MNLQTVFGILVILYTVSNLASMGLELNLRETIKSLRSARQVELYAPIAPLVFYAIFGSSRDLAVGAGSGSQNENLGSTHFVVPGSDAARTFVL
jgi:hypothetical protein